MTREHLSPVPREGTPIRSAAVAPPGSRIALASGEWLEHAANLIGLALGCRGIALPAGEEVEDAVAAGDVYVSVAPGNGRSQPVFCPDASAAGELDSPLPAGVRSYAIIPLPRPNVEGVPCSIDADIELRVLHWALREWTESETASLHAVATFLAGDLDVRYELSLSQRTAEELRIHSLRDTLTGLPNRALFLDRLSHAIERSKRHKEFRFAVLSLDIDRFNAVNDSLGQMIGDEVLVAVARRLETCVRGEDTLGRLSGDEFVVLLESISNDSDGSRVAERMRRSLVEPIHTSEGEVFVSASIGIVLNSSGTEDAALLIQQAGIATSRAKAAGRDRYEMYDRAMHSKALARLRT